HRKRHAHQTNPHSRLVHPPRRRRHGPRHRGRPRPPHHPQQGAHDHLVLRLRPLRPLLRHHPRPGHVGQIHLLHLLGLHIPGHDLRHHRRGHHLQRHQRLHHDGHAAPPPGRRGRPHQQPPVPRHRLLARRRGTRRLGHRRDARRARQGRRPGAVPDWVLDRSCARRCVAGAGPWHQDGVGRGEHDGRRKGGIGTTGAV
ncbi:hypothetical protein E4U42_000815, partial [Claviceps africana]